MRFEKNTVYHIYNQGNNRQQVFFQEENYLFFLRKMREFVLPYADFLCYCLMPNHFHWLVYVKEVVLEIKEDDDAKRGKGSRPSEAKNAKRSDGVTRSHPVTTMRTLNQSIGILLRSYSRAINKEENRSGALFGEETKAKDGWENPYLTPLHPDYGKIWQNWDIYGNTCFHYIHNNPVKPGLVKEAKDWDYSSARDFAGERNGTLCNQALAKDLLRLPEP